MNYRHENSKNSMNVLNVSFVFTQVWKDLREWRSRSFALELFQLKLTGHGAHVEKTLLIGRTPADMHKGHGSLSCFGWSAVAFWACYFRSIWARSKQHVFQNSYQECHANMFQSTQIKLVRVTSSEQTEHSPHRSSNFVMQFFATSVIPRTACARDRRSFVFRTETGRASW